MLRRVSAFMAWKNAMGFILASELQVPDCVCVIRANPATDSDAIRPPVPTEVGHLFRSNPASPSRWV
jgi:hypothetical protein